MTWIYQSALLYGDVANLQAGDRAIITLADVDDPDASTVELVYTYDGTLTPSAIIAMAKRETVAHLAQLNKILTTQDVTNAFRP